MESIKSLKKLISKKVKQDFPRYLWWKFPKFRNKPSWRRPRGKDNPVRIKLKGYPPLVNVGRRVPRVIRGLHPAALRPVTVSNPEELDSLKPSEVIVYVASSVGLRKKQAIMLKAEKLGFKVANSGW